MAEMDIDPSALRRLTQHHTRVASDTLARAEPATAIAPGEKPPNNGTPRDNSGTDGKTGNDHPTGGPTPKQTTPSSGGAGQHYGKPIELDPPPGASAALTSFVSMAETAIQTTVDLLGRGITEPPPNVNDLLTTVTYRNLGKGEADDAYQQTLTKVQARQTYLLNMDAEVVKTSIKVKDGKDQTLAAVMADVHKLKGALEVDLRPLSKKLKAAKELELMERIADTLDSVCQKVSAVAEYNKSMAGENSGSGSGNTSSTGGTQATGGTTGQAAAGGGDGGLGGLAQMLGPLAMMLPMGLMSLAPMVQQFIQSQAEQHDKEEQERKDQAKQDQQAQQAQANGAAPGTAGAAPATAGPAAPAAPAVTAPQPGGVTADPAVLNPPADAQNPAPVAPAAPEGATAPSVSAPSGGSIPGAPG